MGRRDAEDRGHKPRLDRFGTYNLFCQNTLSGIAGGSNGSPATAVVWFVLWGLANGRTGIIKGATISRLALLTGFDRVTVRKAVLRLLKDGAIAKEGAGRGSYTMPHAPKQQDR